MLKVENITKYYGDFLAVDNLSFEVKKGEVFGLLGSNGAGKTTTFRIIMGLLDATKGKVTLDGKEINYDITDDISFVTEERSLIQKLTVYEQLYFYGTLKGLTTKEINERLDLWLEKFGIPEYKYRKISELSKGNQQKIQFVSAVLNNPKLLVLDEPFTGLDPINVEMFNSAIKDLSKKGCIIIFSSHQMEFIEQFCEKLMILVKGKPVLNGMIKDIKREYQKKNIFIRGDVSNETLRKVKGVLDIEKTPGEYIVKVENENVAKEVFKAISKYDITKFVIEEATLKEIFIDKVGEAYEKE